MLTSIVYFYFLVAMVSAANQAVDEPSVFEFAESSSIHVLNIPQAPLDSDPFSAALIGEESDNKVGTGMESNTLLPSLDSKVDGKFWYSFHHMQ